MTRRARAIPPGFLSGIHHATRIPFRSSFPVARSSPLTDDQIRAVAPSIFAVDNASRSDRYTYIPTGEVLTALRREGFEPFMVCQTRVRQDDRRDFTKHMVRLRHARHTAMPRPTRSCC